MHKTIARVTEDLEKFGFNRAVARVREFTNALAELGGENEAACWVRRRGLETLTRLIGPMMPHLAEELWQRLGHARLLCDEAWPEADPRLLVEDQVTLAVQVNGKLRGTIDLARDAPEDEAREAALALPNVAGLLAGRAPRKVVVVANRVVNIVA